MLGGQEHARLEPDRAAPRLIEEADIALVQRGLEQHLVVCPALAGTAPLVGPAASQLVER